MQVDPLKFSMVCPQEKRLTQFANVYRISGLHSVDEEFYLLGYNAE
jgi:hypothetical protein